jgi:hypothetical protein
MARSARSDFMSMVPFQSREPAVSFARWCDQSEEDA